MKYKREATLFKTARFPIRGLITNGLMIPINRSDTPTADQIKRERTFVENVGNFRKLTFWISFKIKI